MAMVTDSVFEMQPNRGLVKREIDVKT
jgi:hypothetical protein